MRLFFDLRLGYLVDAPGQSSPLQSLSGKAGDGQPVEIQFGRSSDPVGGGSFFEGPSWEPEQLPGATIIKIGIKLAGEFSDGEFLASTATFSYDSESESYTGSLNLNTEEIDAALNRGDDDDENDEPSVACGFELTYQPGGSGPWRSSQEPVSYLLRHDLIYGDEATPVSAADPDEYLLKQNGIVWLPDVVGLVGGTGSDLDSIPTTTLDLGVSVALLDEGASPDALRFYRLEASDDATDAPGVIRPTDYEATTNEKVWRLYAVSGDSGMANPMTAAGDLIRGGTAGAATRLAIGTNGHALQVVSGQPTWAALPTPPEPRPVSIIYADSSKNLVPGDSGYLIVIDSSSGNVDLSITEAMTDDYPAETHFWISRSSASNDATVSVSGATTINGSGSPLAIAVRETVHLWRAAADDWWKI